MFTWPESSQERDVFVLFQLKWEKTDRNPSDGRWLV